MKAKGIDDLWSHVHWLGVLGERGSFTAAAQRLGVSKAAVSTRIAELEHAAGVSLVRRTTRSSRLTEAGQQLVDATRAPFQAIEHSFAGVRDLAAKPTGSLRITVAVALGQQRIVPLLPRFLSQFPSVRLEVDLSDRLSSLAQEGFDLAIRHAETIPDSYVAWTLCQTRSLLVASAQYLERRGTPGAPEDLAGHDCLYYLRGGPTPTWSFEAVKPGKTKAAAGSPAGRISLPIRGPLAANNSETLREMALAGVGIALLPDFSAAAALRAGALRHVLPSWRPVGAFGSRIHAVRPYSPYVPRAVRAFVDFLRRELKGGVGA
ncbi:MAG: LysR family transcriptional regulator [Lautropia sp.]